MCKSVTQHLMRGAFQLILTVSVRGNSHWITDKAQRNQ